MDSGVDGYSSHDYRVDRERMEATAKSAREFRRTGVGRDEKIAANGK